MWFERIQSIDFTLKKWSLSTMTGFCQVILTLPTLKKLSFTWQCSENEAKVFQNEYIQTLSKSNITNVGLDYSDSAIDWDISTTNLFASWILEKPVSNICVSCIPSSEVCTEILFGAIMGSSTLVHCAIANLLQVAVLKKIHTLPPALKTLWLHASFSWNIECTKSMLQHSKVRDLKLTNGSDDEDEFEDCTEFTYDFWTSTLPSMLCLQYLEINKFEVNTDVLATILPRLINLKLIQNGITDTQAFVIIKTVPKCTRLESLDFAFQQLTFLSALELSVVIPKCQSLKALNLQDNFIGSVGALGLSRVLKYLDIVNFSRNNIGFDGAAAISRYLCDTEHMKYLLLNGNFIDTDGILSIIRALSKSKYRQGCVQLINIIPTDESYDTCRIAMESLPNKSWVKLYGRFQGMVGPNTHRNEFTSE
ncbi:hypothetical protein THRCLA_22302 [Thraustotheca clavata]|uniref:Uncharacterized protein n=1 Tax=Thraustotheca clavata TaxID=74557 RepID=A0A1V9Z6U1_9STRA|nr:hypothetical protein THRCLA_22302 [Thraustotheca clavata]